MTHDIIMDNLPTICVLIAFCAGAFFGFLFGELFGFHRGLRVATYQMVNNHRIMLDKLKSLRPSCQSKN